MSAAQDSQIGENTITVYVIDRKMATVGRLQINNVFSTNGSIDGTISFTPISLGVEQFQRNVASSAVDRKLGGGFNDPP